MIDSKEFTENLPKTNFRFFYQAENGQVVTCDEEWVNALTKIAIMVASKPFRHSIAPKIEVISFSPNQKEKPRSSILLQFPFLRSCFSIYIKVDGLKERIHLTGYIDLFLSEVYIKREGDEKYIKRSTPFCSSTVVEDVAKLLLDAIRAILSIISHNILA